MNDGKPLFSTAHPTPMQSWLQRALWPLKNWWWSRFWPRKSSIEKIEVVVAEPCPYPTAQKHGWCCGHSPCDLEFYYPCDAEGGCWDRATCGPYGCATPITMKPN